MTLPVKKNWLEVAIDVANFHIKQCEEEDGWTIIKTAAVLGRSKSSVANYVTVAFWYQTHGHRISKFKSMNDALDYINDRKKEMKMRMIEK